jgi:hypothetical protein
MAKEMSCATHGECQEAFVCTHLLGETAGLGFNRSEPTTDNPFVQPCLFLLMTLRVSLKG